MMMYFQAAGRAGNTLIPNDSGWHLTRADGINNHGQVVGKGIHNGHTRAFLLTPIR